ncbi:hypothetical protein [Schlesneria paludicola]|uniref:hypothetical protein n=1 Tax=Schlesneria paludicola TaxID=360056 RepID=UPI0004926531|nr:hypothetical protein [Schlesneria paludicola]
MSSSPPNSELKLPVSLQTQLHDFRRRVWTIKSIEAACGALFGVIVSFLIVFGLDRVIDTPAVARLAIFAVAVAGCAFVPIYLHRWIWCHRRLEQLARLLSRRHPSIGDQMLGIIELVRNELEQQRSRALCEAAIQQVAEVAAKRNFQDAVPHPRHRLWAWMAGIPTVVAAAVLIAFPTAASNAWARFVTPWQPISRYTFTQVEPLNDRLVVPHGEPVVVPVRLVDQSPWQPTRGTVRIGSQLPVTAELNERQYAFSLPPQIDAGRLDLNIGDAQQHVRLEPMLRPELTHVTADIHLPAYLGRPQTLHKDVRGGVLTVVNGSNATLTATANRNLVEGTWGTADRPDDKLAAVSSTATPSDTMQSPSIAFDASQKILFQWKDEFGLMGKEPLTVTVNAREDEVPSLSCEDLPRNKVIIDSETLTFKIRAQDDFGVKQVGIEWKGIEDPAVSKRAKGERMLAAGGNELEQLELTGTFCAKTLEIEPQPLSVRLFVEDYFPGRPRTYSQPYVLYVLNAEQHSIWLTEQLSKWHRQSLEVRDREMQLHHTNQELRMLSTEQLDQPDNRRRIETQSNAERANGRRLTGLVNGGEDLIRQAMRNPEFGVGHLEKWAEMLQILRDISGNRMPSVADLLKQSSQAAAAVAEQTPKPTGPVAGQSRSSPGAGEPKTPDDSKPKPPVPTVADGESSQNPAKKKDGPPEEPSKSKSNPRLTLPVTTIMTAGDNKPQPPAPAAEKLDEAIKVQQDLLAEFDKIADELNKVLANLEGSTLVKRLKAASRKQYVVAGKIGEQINGGFGQKSKPAGPVRDALSEISKQELDSSHEVSLIMDDMQSYFERRRYQRFKTVLDDMRDQDAIGSIRQLSDDVRTETGFSIAQAEFWSDTFDRWADDLVDPACCGKCPGCKSKASLPPSIVLEAMQILEAEVALREETRVAEQARAAVAVEEYGDQAKKLSLAQDALSERVTKLIERIRELPDAETEFFKEIKLLGEVEVVMDDATEILASPSTGSDAIGAETEAIELLLKSKKIKPKTGGGGGSSPGGGGNGTTSDSALAMVGSGVNDKEVREDRGISQTTGESGTPLPEEFRSGLDEYFNRLERDPAK